MTNCIYCPHRCSIQEGGYGRCAMYTVSDGMVVERYPDHWLIVTPVSIETIPFVHFQPNAKALQVSTIGCNFSCSGCVSEVLVRSPDEIGAGLTHHSPEEIMLTVQKEGCQGIVFCLNEPVVSLPSFIRLAKSAKEEGLFVACSSNGYWTDETYALLSPYLDAVNIGIKGISDSIYKKCGALSPEPVFKTLEDLYRDGIHTEVAVIHANGMEDEMDQIIRYIHSVSKDIPIQIMRCMAFGELSPDAEPAIPESEVLCSKIRTFHPYTYLFNSPGTAYLDSVCPVCGELLIKREMYGPMGCRITDIRQGSICSCGYNLLIKPPIHTTRYEEMGMVGGYRPTRALEIFYGIVSCLGGGDEGTVITDLWKSCMAQGRISMIHEKVQDIPSYYEVVRMVAGVCGREEEGESLVTYLQDTVQRVHEAVQTEIRPRVYYSMGYPLFALNPGRFEHGLVEAAGGIAVNRTFSRNGKPGFNLTDEEFCALNPEWIGISGLFSLPADDCKAFCMSHNLFVDAIMHDRIIQIPPSWDFGSPRWALGLMLIANHLHPDLCRFDMNKEADIFYQRFYGVPYDNISHTRSFIRPSASKENP